MLSSNTMIHGMWRFHSVHVISMMDTAVYRLNFLSFFIGAIKILIHTINLMKLRIWIRTSINPSPQLLSFNHFESIILS